MPAFGRERNDLRHFITALQFNRYCKYLFYCKYLQNPFFDYICIVVPTFSTLVEQIYTYGKEMAKSQTRTAMTIKKNVSLEKWSAHFITQ